MTKKEIKQVPQVEHEVIKYDGWLLSDNFFKRALAVWGHAVMGYLFIVLILFGVAMVFSLFLVFIGVFAGA